MQGIHPQEKRQGHHLAGNENDKNRQGEQRNFSPEGILGEYESRAGGEAHSEQGLAGGDEKGIEEKPRIGNPFAGKQSPVMAEMEFLGQQGEGVEDFRIGFEGREEHPQKGEGEKAAENQKDAGGAGGQRFVRLP